MSLRYHKGFVEVLDLMVGPALFLVGEFAARQVMVVRERKIGTTPVGPLWGSEIQPEPGS